MNHLNSMPDEKLIQFYLNGDPNAMATLVELYKDRIYRSIYNIVQDRNAAEEIFQEVFIRLINNMIAGNMNEDGNFLQWGTRIAQNLCVEYTRRTKLAVVLPEPADAGTGFSLQAAMPGTNYHESHDKIKNMIDLLPDGQREVLLLSHYGGLSFKEIAEQLKCTLQNALDNMKFGLNSLRKMMTTKEMAL
jgi:RNA polymerase sigma-70 factor (ECF subfamily)